jgi:hypothetical protein
LLVAKGSTLRRVTFHGGIKYVPFGFHR